MSNPYLLKSTFYDHLLQQAVSQVYLQSPADDTLALLIRTDQQSACSAAIGLVTLSHVAYGPTVVPGASTLYGTNRDLAVMQFSFADNTTALVAVIGPKATCFLGDTITVDPSGALAAFIGDVVTYGCNKSGSPCTGFLKGWRDKAPNF